jgi:hypothetical protein
MLQFECECGNRTGFFATGARDEQGREYIDPEDDDRVTFMIGDDSVVFRCSFCGHRYRLQRYPEAEG